MDPYLEMPPFWSDFTPKLLTAISNELLSRLVPRYDVRIEEYLVLTEEDIHLHRLRPDVTVSAAAPWSTTTGAGMAVAEPATAEMEYPAYEPHTQRRLKIIHQPTEKVVTVVNCFRRATSAGRGGLTYLEKH
jgi:hypothetical protein